MIRSILFDIDGVLLDSFEANSQYYRDIMAHGGYPRPTKGQIKSIFHLPLTDGIKLLTGTPEAEAATIVEAAYASLPYPRHLLKLGEGAKEVVKKLCRTYLLGIATSRRSRGIDVFFEFSKMKKYFGAAVGYEDVERLKPNPDPLLLAAKRLGIEPANAVYVGDAATDMEAANAAGMYAITYGKRRHPGAHQQVSSFFHLPEAVKLLY